MMKIYTTMLCIIFSTLITQAEPTKSLLDVDPDVIYINEHIDQTIYLLTTKPTTVYATKKGTRRLGAYPANTKVELLAITDKAYRVKGQASHAGVTGWVNPKSLASKDKDFIANLKKLYLRQLIVKEIIAKNDIAIGMTTEEALKSIGNPTETEVKQTRKGESGKWHYIVQEEHKHYRIIRDPYTGNPYRQLSHITTEETSRITLELENNTITSVTRKDKNGPAKVRIIPVPVVFQK